MHVLVWVFFEYVGTSLGRYLLWLWVQSTTEERQGSNTVKQLGCTLKS